MLGNTDLLSIYFLSASNERTVVFHPKRVVQCPNHF